jgi:hypothetical protein
MSLLLRPCPGKLPRASSKHEERYTCWSFGAEKLRSARHSQSLVKTRLLCCYIRVVLSASRHMMPSHSYRIARMIFRLESHDFQGIVSNLIVFVAVDPELGFLVRDSMLHVCLNDPRPSLLMSLEVFSFLALA